MEIGMVLLGALFLFTALGFEERDRNGDFYFILGLVASVIGLIQMAITLIRR
jgi:hypothetical protein